MTYTELKVKMYERGMLKSQVESKSVLAAYGILSGTETLAEDVAKMQADLMNATAETNRMRTSIERQKERLEKEKKDFLEEKKNLEEYIDEFNKSLKECETPEARDAMRTAQFLVNTVEINTDQNNTAFIYGLSMICAGKAFSFENGMKKVRGAFPEIHLGRI